MKITHSPRFLQQRKFFLTLPLLTLPFITLLFWLLDGGKGKDAQAQPSLARKGLNLELPTAYLPEEKPLNKLSYYEKAASDSARLEKLLKNDPYYHPPLKPAGKGNSLGAMEQSQQLASNSLNTTLRSPADIADTQEAQLYQKLEQVNTALQKTTIAPTSKLPSEPKPINPPGSSLNQSDMDRLEQMMGLMKNGTVNEDPEMKQINTMLEKILAIQHPESIREKLQPASPTRPGPVLSATVHTTEPISLLTPDKGPLVSGIALAQEPFTGNSFYSLAEDEAEIIHQQNAIPAVVHETQTLVDGAVVKLRLQRDIYLNGVQVPAGTLVYGTASLQGERLQIKINDIRYQQSLFPVELTVWDVDGLNGIQMPGTLTREVARQSTNQALQGMGLTTFDPSLGAQAAGAGLEAAKSLLNKKAKLVKVTVKAGYQVLLRAEKQKALPDPAALKNN
jgi:conjugative transposon TraM protein